MGDWRPLGTDGTIEHTWLVLTKDGKGTSVGGKTCKYGRHEASSAGAFELYVWGTDTFASYGYPAGAGSRPATRSASRSTDVLPTSSDAQRTPGQRLS